MYEWSGVVRFARLAGRQDGHASRRALSAIEPPTVPAADGTIMTVHMGTGRATHSRALTAMLTATVVRGACVGQGTSGRWESAALPAGTADPYTLPTLSHPCCRPELALAPAARAHLRGLVSVFVAAT